MARLFSSRKLQLMLNYEHVNPTRSSRSWGRYVLDTYGGNCLVTGESHKVTECEIHHLFSNHLLETNGVSSWDAKKLKLSLLNGVVLTKDLHKRFHHEYGTKVTPLMFISFLNTLERENSDLDKQRIQEVKAWVLCLYREVTFLYPVVRTLKLNKGGNV